MTENLKRCPFCGSEAEFKSDEFGEGVCCKSCGATMHNGVYGEEGRKLASAEWNSRLIENELTGKIGKLEAENMRLQRKLNESIDDNYKNAWKIQQQAERGAKFAQKENMRLREALELIAKSNFYFARGEEDKQLSRVCEIARNALNGNEK